MRKRDIKIQIYEILWEKALEKIETDFGKSYCNTKRNASYAQPIICIWQLIIQTSLLHLHINL